MTNKMFRNVLTLTLVFLVADQVFATGGAGALTNANTQIRTYWAPLRLLIQGVGGVVGVVGGLRIYNKWTNGDQDVNKELIGWGGACLFLIIAPQFVSAFFA